MLSPQFQKWIIGLLLVGTVIFSLFMYLVGESAEGAGVSQAQGIARMTMGLIVVWICIGGGLMYRFRDTIRSHVQKIPLDWRVKFVLVATLLACLEEMVTVSLTNMAPLFGAKVGEAFITASTNYFDVIFLHSVIVFIPLFIAWAFILQRYDFKPFSVFLLFGIMGTMGESTIIGPTAFIGFPMWLFVYGLMVYLPAYSIPENRGARKVLWYHYLYAIPSAFLIALPMLIPIVYIITGVLDHPSIHF